MDRDKEVSEMTSRRDFIKTSASAAGLAALSAVNPIFASNGKRPNIMWIFAEDICPDLSCYGVPGVHTPNLDRLASRGVRFENAFVTAPVCSAARSAMMTGCHQNFIGSNQHRTNKKRPLPHGVKPFPIILQEAGYFTLVQGKNDLNFKHAGLSSGKDVRQREPGQPFFWQKTFHATHRSFHREHDDSRLDKIEIPPYYPDLPLVRRDWGNYLKTIEDMDKEVGKFLDWMESEGLMENTMVIFLGDHGRCMPRAKQFLYDGGLHVPLIIRRPNDVGAGRVDKELASSIDLAATILAAAGIEKPAWMHGRDLFDDSLAPREYVFAARDKMDNTHDAMRAIRSKDFKYIENLMPERAWCQFNKYKEDKYPVLALLNVMHMKGELTPAQDRFMQPTKPEEELFDLRSDPYEIHNLADDPQYAGVKKRLRAELERWRRKIGDEGVSEEFRKGGWPSEYPTRTLEEWEAKLRKWNKYLFEK